MTIDIREIFTILVQNDLWPGHLTLKERSKVKSDGVSEIAIPDYLYIGKHLGALSPLVSKILGILVQNDLWPGHLTLKERSEVKSKCLDEFLIPDFLYVSYICQSCISNR